MKVRRKTVAALAVTIAAVIAVTGLAGAGSAAPKQQPLLAALVSDIGRFNDKSFNQSQLQGLNRAKAVLGVRRASAPVELPSGLHPEPDDRGRPWRERDHLRRVPDGDGVRRGRQQRPG